MKIKFKLLLVFGSILLTTIVILSVVFYYSKKDALIESVDSRLLTSAHFASKLMGDDFHDKIMDEHSISKSEYLKIVDQYNQICKELDLQYIWSLMVVDSQIVFTSGTSTSKDIDQGDHAQFFEVHTNPDAYRHVFATMKTEHSTFHDQWGAGRMVLIPNFDHHGRKYLFAASINLNEVHAMVVDATIKVISLSIIIIVIAIMITLFISNTLSKPIIILTQTAKKIAHGEYDRKIDLRGYTELDSLSASINFMSGAIKEKVREIEDHRENLHITLNSIGDAVITTDKEGLVTGINPAGETLTGWDEIDALGRPVDEVFYIVNSLTGDPVENPVNKILKSGNVVGLANHTKLISRTGKEYQIADSGAPIKNSLKEIVGVVLVFRDVTLEYQKDQQIRESEATLSSIFRVAPVGIAMLRNRIIIKVNDFLCEMTGYDQEELINQSTGMLYASEEEYYRAGQEKNWNNNENISASIETQWKTKDGQIKNILLNACLLHPDDNNQDVTITALDITDRVKAEKNLRSAYHLLDTIFSNTPIVAIEGYKPDGTITSWNNAAEELYKYRADEVLGKKLQEVILKDDEAEVFLNILKNIEKSKEPTRPQYWEIVTKEGRQRWVYATMIPIIENEKVTQIFCMDVDVTERIEYERALKQTTEKLNEAQSIACIGSWDWNVKTNEVWWSDEVYRIFELDPDKYTPNFEENLEFFHPDDIETFYNQFEKAKDSKLRNTFNVRLITPKGRIKHCRLQSQNEFSDDGVHLRMFGTIQDISNRIKAERALKQSEERYRRITENAQDMIFRMSLPDGRYEFVSRASEIMFGYTPREFLETPVLIRKVFHPDWHEYFDREWQNLLEGNMPPYYEYKIIHGNGEEKWIHQRNVLIRDDDGQPSAIEGICTDITSLREYQAELERLNIIIESTTDLVSYADKNETVQYINKAGRHYLGIDEKAQPKKIKINDIHPPDVYNRIINEALPIAAQKGFWTGETHIITNDGRRIPTSQIIMAHKNKKGEVEHISTIIRDVSDIVKVREDLFAEKERLSVTLKSIGDAVITTDTKGNVILLNNVAEELTGWSQKEALGKPLTDIFNIISEIDRTPCPNPVETVLEKKKVVGLANHTILISRNGSERYIADSGAPIKDANDDIIGVVLVFRDVTESKRYRDLAERAQRLETAGTIAGQVAHDFNNLLGPLVAYPDIIKAELPQDHPVINFVDAIERAAVQIADINQQLLTLGRRGHYNLEPLNLNVLIDNIVKNIESEGDSIYIETDLSDALMNIKGGPAQLQRAITNLIINAGEAIGDNGQITIKTENYYNDQSTGTMTKIPKGEYVKLIISDNGHGIPQKKISEIFLMLSSRPKPPTKNEAPVWD